MIWFVTLSIYFQSTEYNMYTLKKLKSQVVAQMTARGISFMEVLGLWGFTLILLIDYG